MTQPREHCGKLAPTVSLIGQGKSSTECILRPGHSGSHATDNGMRWWLTTPTPTALRDRYAAAIASYDHAVGLATDPAPRDHHYGQADAVLAVRDRELEQARAEAAELRQRFDNQAQAGSELIEERRQLEDRVRRVADLIAAGAPWTANHEDTAARIRAAVQAEES